MWNLHTKAKKVTPDTIIHDFRSLFPMIFSLLKIDNWRLLVIHRGINQSRGRVSSREHGLIPSTWIMITNHNGREKISISSLIGYQDKTKISCSKHYSRKLIFPYLSLMGTKLKNNKNCLRPAKNYFARMMASHKDKFLNAEVFWRINYRNILSQTLLFTAKAWYFYLA